MSATKDKGRSAANRTTPAHQTTSHRHHNTENGPIKSCYQFARQASRVPKPGGQFRRDRLPGPEAYYAEQGVKLTGRGAWRDALCPFHEDNTPSLRVRVETGGFRCMACGAHGGDVLDFHRQRHGLGFVEAARALGAWRGGR